MGKKQWFTIAAVCLIICVMAGGFLWYASGSVRDSDSKTDMKMEGIRLALANLSAAQAKADRDFEAQLRDNLGLLSLPLRSIAARDGDKAIQNYTYGCVLRRDGDRYVLPEDTTALPALEPQAYEGDMPYTPAECQPFRDDEGAFWSRLQDAEDDGYVLCAYRRLTGDYYYLYYMPLSGVETFFQTRYDTAAVLAGTETIYDGYFAAWIEDDDGYRPYYGSESLGSYDQPSDLGIVIGKGKSGFRPVTIGEERYMYAVSAPRRVPALGKNIRIAYVIPHDSYYGTAYGNTVVLLVIAAAVFLVLTVWVLSARRVMGGGTVTQTQRRVYGARHLRRVAVSLGAVGFVVLLLTGMYLQALSDIYNSTTTCQSALDTLLTMSAENSSHEERIAGQRSDQYLSYAQRIAVLLGLYPELKTREQLAEMSGTIGADYLMLFDDKGREILSDAPFVNLTYGGSGSSSTYDFRRLISGVQSIVHPARVDEVTGLNRQLIGVAMDDGDVSDGYASLIVAVLPLEAGEDALSMGDIMRSLITVDGVIFAVDHAGTVMAASAPSLVGKNVTELGMREQDLRDGFMDFFALDGTDRYGYAVEQGETLYYSAVRTSSMFDNLVGNSLVPGLIFLAAYALLVIVLFRGYTEKAIDGSGVTVVDDHDWAYRERVKEEDEQKRGWWARKTPESRAGFVLMVLLAAGLAAVVVMYSTGGMRGGNMAIIPYVLGGGWTRGFNLFALTLIVILTGVVVLVLLGMRGLLSILCGVLETKGETVCRLSFSLLRCLVVIVGLFCSLEALGFDPATLLASLGIFSLALSLGAKDLVADVLSGIMIVFSGEYQIGDIVEIAGFRGRVWAIGVRSTTIVNKDGHMKNISNRNVSNVMNLSRLNSRYTLHIAIPYDQPLDDVKAMLDRELPAIGRGIDGIANGPAYVGVTGMDAGYVTLGFCAECAEEDMDKVCDKMNVAIKALFEKHGIPIK